MSRRGGTPKRTVTPDPLYKSTVVTKLINQIMLDVFCQNEFDKRRNMV